VSSLRHKFTLALATGAGVGYSRFFPGTMGSLVAVPISLALNRLAETMPMFALIVLVGLTVGAIWLSNIAAELLQTKDPQIIVVDEIVGFMIANFLAPRRWTPLLLGFLLFRIFDIAKIYPAARLEKLPGGFGIVLDDVLAGFYAFVIVQTLLYWRWL